MRASRPFRCPMCASASDKLLPAGIDLPVLHALEVVGAGFRPAARCPSCSCCDRDRLVFLFLRRQLARGRAPSAVLHLAPEWPIEAWLRDVPDFAYVTADLQPGRGQVALEASAAPFASESFDWVIANHVLEHVPADRRAMREFFRVLRPGGLAVLQVPIATVLGTTYEDPTVTAPDARAAAFGQDDHVRMYGRDYVDRLRDAGFRVRAVRWQAAPRTFGGPHNPNRLIWRERLFVASKPARRRH